MTPELIDLGMPNQPTDPEAFPFRLMSGKQRRCNPSWFKSYPWLHYDTPSDSVLCFTCCKASRLGALSASKSDTAFTSKGFRNWKNALAKNGFPQHDKSDAHREAELRVNLAPSSAFAKADAVLSESSTYEQMHNRKMLLAVLGLSAVSHKETERFRSVRPYVCPISTSEFSEIW